MMRRSTLLLGILATGFLAAACSGDPPSGSGPLGTPGPSGNQCVPAPIRIPRAMGIFNLRNSGRAPVTIRAVNLTRDTSLGMGKAWLTPIFNTTLIGTAVWPPTAKAWRYRVPARGAVIKPGQDLNLVFAVWFNNSGRRSGESHVTIRYNSNGASYKLTEGLTITIAHRC